MAFPNIIYSNPFSLCEYVPEQTKQSVKDVYGKSEKFDSLKQEAIQELSTLLLEMQQDFDETDIDNCTNFKAILQKAIDWRYDIAITTETQDAEDFRTRRSSDRFFCTSLCLFQYKEVNRKIKELVLESFPKIVDRNKGRCIAGLTSRYTVRLARATDLENLLAYSGEDHNRRDEIKFNFNVHNEYKTKREKLHTTTMTQLGRETLASQMLPDKNIYIYSGRIEVLTDGQWQTLTRHYAILGCNDNGEVTAQNIQDFKLHGFVTLLHTNADDFKLLEPSIARLFNKVMSRNSNEEDRKPAMREFEYRIHHMLYTKRGGQADCEMIIEAMKIALLPHYEIKGHLEALSEPLLDRYMQAL